MNTYSVYFIEIELTSIYFVTKSVIYGGHFFNIEYIFDTLQMGHIIKKSSTNKILYSPFELPNKIFLNIMS